MEGGSYWTRPFVGPGFLKPDAKKEDIVKASLDKASENWGLGLIDDLDNIEGSPVFIMSGNFDHTVPPQY